MIGCLQSPQLRAELARVGVQSVADIRRRKIGDNLTIGPLLQAMTAPPNSDFFPYVDLNAPRLRYMRETAIGLPALTVLPMPFLELLDGDAPRSATAEPAVNSALFRDRLVRRALDIRRAVSSDSLDNLDPLSATYLWRIDASRNGCAAGPAQNTWKNAVRNISDETAAYLTAAELDGIWNKVMSSACYRDVTGEHKTWADLLAADLASRRPADRQVRYRAARITSLQLRRRSRLSHDRDRGSRGADGGDRSSAEPPASAVAAAQSSRAIRFGAA